MKKTFKIIAALAALISMAACQKTVEKVLKDITLDTTNVTVEFTVGQEFSYAGLEVTATYSDHSTAKVTNFQVTPPDMTTAGEGKEVKVSYTEGKVTAENSYQITVKVPKDLTGIFLNTDAVKTDFIFGEAFTSEGLIVTATYLDGTEGVVTGYQVTPPDMTTPGEGKEVKVSYTEKSITKESAYSISVYSVMQDSLVVSSKGYTNQQEVKEAETDGKIAVISFSKGTGSNVPKYYTVGESIRVYSGGNFSVESNYRIVGIKVVYDSGDNGNEVTADCGTYTDGVWTGESYKVTFTVTGTSGHRRISKIYVNYDIAAPTAKTFSVDPAEVEIASDATVAEFNVIASEGLAWTASCNYEGVSVSPASGTGNGSVKVTVPVNTTYAAKEYTLVLQTEDPLAKVHSISATVSQSGVVISTIADINGIATAEGAAFIANLSGATVTFVNNSNAFIEDNTAGCLIYLNNHGLTAGDKISGKVTGTVKLYNGYGEITAMDYSEATKTAGQPIPTTEVTVAQINATPAKYYNMRVALKGVTFTKAVIGKADGEISQSEAVINVRGQNNEIAFYESLTGDLVGYPQAYQGANQITVYENGWFTVTSKAIIINETNVKKCQGLDPAAQTDIVVENAYELFNAVDADADVQYDGVLVTAASIEGGNLKFSVSENTTDQQRTGSIELTLDGQKKSITVTQNGAGATPASFVKVTSALTDWSGKYLIVYEDGNVAFDGSLSNLDSTPNTVAVTISGGTSIVATADLKSKMFTVAKKSGAADGIYNLQAACGKYISGTTTKATASNGIKSADTDADYEISFEYNDGTMMVYSQSSGAKMKLQFNDGTGQKKFRFFKLSTTMKNIALYKLQEE